MAKKLSSNNYNELVEDEDCDEKKFKEEIVLIGEKCDIESLLDNQNNQLFNLILANSSRSKAISSLESDLNRERCSRIKETSDLKSLMENGDDIQIEIEYQDREEQKSVENRYENDLRDVAKYLVDEITKISVNKLKIDNLNETLDEKFFKDDSQIRQEILSNLVEVRRVRVFVLQVFTTFY